MFILNDNPGRSCEIDGKEFLFFSGYSYLGMNHVKEFTDLIKEGISSVGVLFPSSRISNTRLKLYDTFEKKLSGITGMEDTVSFSSGFLAGKTISGILSTYQHIAVAPGTHPAISIKETMPSLADNFNDWKNEITALINSSEGNKFVLVSDTVNILKAEVNNFSFVENINPLKKIIFLVDDSHGIGILGNNGEGIASSLKSAANVDYIICYSMSKAFSIEGGAVSCSRKWCDLIRKHPHYSGSTAINPSLAYAFLKSDELYAIQRKKLFQNMKRFKKMLPGFISPHDYNIPVFICKNENAEDVCFKKRIIISSFAYPDPSSRKINRIVINALHTKKDLKKICSV